MPIPGLRDDGPRGQQAPRLGRGSPVCLAHAFLFLRNFSRDLWLRCAESDPGPGPGEPCPGWGTGMGSSGGPDRGSAGASEPSVSGRRTPATGMSPEAGQQGRALLSATPRRTCPGTSEGQCGGQCDFRGVGKAEGGGGRAHKPGRGREQGQGHTGGVQFRRWTQGGSNVLLPAPWGLWWAWHPRMSDVAGAGKPAHARTNVLLSGGL